MFAFTTSNFPLCHSYTQQQQQQQRTTGDNRSQNKNQPLGKIDFKYSVQCSNEMCFNIRLLIFFFCHFAHLVSCRHFGWHSMSLDSNDKCYLVSDQSQTNKRKSYSLAQEERLKLRYIYNMNDIRQFVVSVWNEIHVKQHQSREI